MAAHASSLEEPSRRRAVKGLLFDRLLDDECCEAKQVLVASYGRRFEYTFFYAWWMAGADVGFEERDLLLQVIAGYAAKSRREYWLILEKLRHHEQYLRAKSKIEAFRHLAESPDTGPLLPNALKKIVTGAANDDDVSTAPGRRKKKAPERERVLDRMIHDCREGIDPRGENWDHLELKYECVRGTLNNAFKKLEGRLTELQLKSQYPS